MTTTKIKITPTKDDDKRECFAWSFTLNGENFGGYCRTKAEAFSEAERHVELQVEPLTDERAGECYKQLVGYNPLHEPSNLPGMPGFMTGEQVRALLSEMMIEGVR